MKKCCQITLIVITLSAVAGCILFPIVDVVKLDEDLGVTTNIFMQDDIVKLADIVGGEVALPFLPDCACTHLHAAEPLGISIIDEFGVLIAGPFPDPSPLGCGYGCIGVGNDDLIPFVPYMPAP